MLRNCSSQRRRSFRAASADASRDQPSSRLGTSANPAIPDLAITAPDPGQDAARVRHRRDYGVQISSPTPSRVVQPMMKPCPRRCRVAPPWIMRDLLLVHFTRGWPPAGSPARGRRGVFSLSAAAMGQAAGAGSGRKASDPCYARNRLRSTRPRLLRSPAR
jgi:hypothetical protein